MRKYQAKGRFNQLEPEGIEQDLERLREEIESEEVPSRLEELGRRLEQLIKLKRVGEDLSLKK